MNKLSFFLLSVFTVALIQGCNNDRCRGDKYIDDINVTDNSLTFLPSVNSSVFVNGNDTMVFTSDGEQSIDTSIVVESYCSDFFGADLIYANSTVYWHYYRDHETGIIIYYYLEPVSYEDYVYNGVALGAMVDMLSIYIEHSNAVIEFDEYYGRIITDTRGDTIPKQFYLTIHYETIQFGNRIYEDVYSEADTNCYFNEDAVNPGPCRTLYRKGKGVVAMQFPGNEFWYAVE